MTRARGQAIAEFALIAPVLLFTCLGFLEAGFLVADKANQDRSTAVVADWAAAHPGDDWQPVAALELPGCDVEVTSPAEPPDLVVAASTCTYRPRVTSNIWQGLPISSEASAAVDPTATAAP